MRFRTEYTPVKSNLTLDPRRPIALVGSCFAQNIARKMKECLWPVFNEAGTLYNPLSIAKVLDCLLLSNESGRIIEDSLFESEGYVHSWLFDSHFSRKSVADCLYAIDAIRLNLIEALEKADALTVTLGTAWCYYLSEKTDFVVANCHKMPQSLFYRRRIAINEIVDVWVDICSRLKEAFPNLNFIFTVSPVRHLKDGFEGNARSKATLLLAVEEICRKVADATYFPAYEIVNDDLRDYRFYASDLVHPSDQAVEYIWELFQSEFLDLQGIQRLREGNKAYRRLNHRPIKN